VLHVHDPDTDTLRAKISSFDSNRISISGDYITTAAGPNNGVVSIEKDEKQGQIFVRVEHSSKPFTLFLTTDTGKNYSIILIPHAMPGQSIIIKPKFETRVVKTKPIAVSQRVARIKKLMKSIANGDVPNRCELKHESINVPWWDGTSFKLNKQFYCGEWIIDQYQLTNQSQKEITITEQEFFHDGVVSVSMNHPHASNVMSLQSHESTIIWLIRDEHHE